MMTEATITATATTPSKINVEYCAVALPFTNIGIVGCITRLHHHAAMIWLGWGSTKKTQNKTTADVASPSG
jgi:hypothetical protein